MVASKGKLRELHKPGLFLHPNFRRCRAWPSPPSLSLTLPTKRGLQGLVGASYCTYAPDTACYIDGWPACCKADSCPTVKPGCEIGYSPEEMIAPVPPPCCLCGADGYCLKDPLLGGRRVLFGVRPICCE